MVGSIMFDTGSSNKHVHNGVQHRILFVSQEILARQLDDLGGPRAPTGRRLGLGQHGELPEQRQLGAGQQDHQERDLWRGDQSARTERQVGQV